MERNLLDRNSDKPSPHPLDTIRKRALAKKLNINPWTLMRWVKSGQFPPPIKLTDIVFVWRVADVEAWLREREGVRLVPEPQKIAPPRRVRVKKSERVRAEA